MMYLVSKCTEFNDHFLDFTTFEPEEMRHHMIVKFSNRSYKKWILNIFIAYIFDLQRVRRERDLKRTP